MRENEQALFREMIKMEIVLFMKISVIIPHSLHRRCIFILGGERGEAQKSFSYLSVEYCFIEKKLVLVKISRDCISSGVSENVVLVQ